MTGDDRIPCPCRRCACRCSSAGGPCWLCSRGIHAADGAVREHLEEGADSWARLLASRTPDSSSGISRRALAAAAETWRAWHDARPCPVRP